MRLSLLLLLPSMLFFTACNDDFFNQVPNDRLTIEEVFKRRAYSEEYLSTVYEYIIDESHRTNTAPWDGCSDDLDVTYDRPKEGYNTFEMNLGRWNASSNYFNYWETHFYRGIRSATYFMNHIGDNTELIESGLENLIVQYRAEARFLRAYFYYGLLRQYGPFVIIGDEVIPGDLEGDAPAMNMPRSPYDKCVQYICDELDKAAENLPLHFTTQDDNDYGRATKAMCLGTKSRVLLLAASPQFNGNPAYATVANHDGTRLFNSTYDVDKWKKAADAAKAVIDLGIFELYKVYRSDGSIDPYRSCRDVFLETWNSEVILTRSNNNMAAWERSASPRQVSGFQSMGVTQQLVDAFRMNDGTDITGPTYVETGYAKDPYMDSLTGWVFTPGYTRNMFVNREPRFYVNVCFNGAYWIGDQSQRVQLYYFGSSGKKGSWDYPRSGYIAIKNVHPNSDPSISRYIKRPNVQMRYAEMLLNYVEALNECNPGHEDIETYLNMIRERGGLGPVKTGLTQDEMREEIRLERRIELCFEQLRYFDTRRWLIAEKTDGGPFWGLNVDAGNSFTDDAFYERTVFETRVFRKEFYLYPIPQDELDKSPQVIQNPYW